MITLVISSGLLYYAWGHLLAKKELWG